MKRKEKKLKRENLHNSHSTLNKKRVFTFGPDFFIFAFSVSMWIAIRGGAGWFRMVISFFYANFRWNKKQKCLKSRLRDSWKFKGQHKLIFYFRFILFSCSIRPRSKTWKGSHWGCNATVDAKPSAHDKRVDRSWGPSTRHRHCSRSPSWNLWIYSWTCKGHESEGQRLSELHRANKSKLHLTCSVILSATRLKVKALFEGQISQPSQTQRVTSRRLLVAFESLACRTKKRARVKNRGKYFLNLNFVASAFCDFFNSRSFSRLCWWHLWYCEPIEGHLLVPCT